MAAIPTAVRAAVAPALLRGAHEIADTARSLAPEDTGALRGSIAVTPPGGRTPPYSQPGGSMVAGETEAIVTAGNSEVRYAHLVEHGTTKAPAHPFFWPAFRSNRRRVTGRIKRAIGKALRDHWGSP